MRKRTFVSAAALTAATLVPVLAVDAPTQAASRHTWNRIADCESGDRWHINTGNGYYGGLQFNLATWRSSGGNRFAKYPHRATKREQIHVANRLYAKRGFSPWSCRP